MPTLTFPLSRIEGHAQVVIEVEDGEVISARFKAMEFRGFEHFVRGIPAEQMPVVTPRICGVCSTAHHLASVKALEDAFEVSPPPLALKLRELLMLGQLIQSHATSMFIFTMPDRLGVTSIFDKAAEEHPVEAMPGIAARALQVRKAGTDLIGLAGGNFIHPIKAIVGGMTSGVGPEAASAVRTQIAHALPVSSELLWYYLDRSVELGDRTGTWGDDAPAYYIAAVSAECPNYDYDRLRVMAHDGEICDEFPARDFRDHLTCNEVDYSYSEQTSYHGEVMRANSLARVNMAKRMGTPLADDYLRQFREAFGQVAHAILLFDLARGIELTHALERSMEILSEPLDQEDTDLPYSPRDGEGYGLVEAPRGPLIHHYTIENGLIAKADFVIPTVHNSMAVERALRVAAERYINADRIDMELTRAVGRVVRAFDPCMACATH